MKYLKLSFAAILLIVLVFSLPIRRASAAVCGENIPTDEGSLRDYIASCSDKLSEISGQKKTLSQAISYLNTQISLTQAKIISTQKELDKLNIEIKDLTGKIDSIDYSLTDLTKLFVARVRETYIRQEKWTPAIILQANSISEAIRRTEYEQRLRDRDREIMITLEKSRLDYNNQKLEKETKQAEVEKLKRELGSQKASLSAQKASKDQLLKSTQNDEKKYQQLLAEAQAELVAIRGIIAGLGKEVKVGNVEEGNRVATIISGRSPCSSGTHLHYEVAQNQQHQNPFQLLRPISLIWDNEDPAQNGSGSWAWPLSEPIRVTQGYGKTSYSAIYAGDVHTGIDMVSSDLTVRAVKTGELYQGSMKCGSGSLFYVRVKQTDGYDSYYLHVNY